MMKEQVYENTFSVVYQEIKRAGAQKCNIPKSIAKEKIEKKKNLFTQMAMGHILKLQKSWSLGKLRETFQKAYD